MPQLIILAPFETGAVFSVPERYDWNDALSDATRYAQWRAVSYPSHVAYPLGAPVAWTPDAQVVSGFAEAPPFLEPTAVEAVMFPIGIGILVLRGRLVAATAERWSAFFRWEEGAYDRLEPVANAARQSFVRVCEDLGVHEFTALRRPTSTTFPWIYSLFLLDEPATDIPPAQAGSGSTVAVDGGRVDVRWRGADVRSEGEYDRTELEALFVAASAAWQTLFATDSLLASTLQTLEEARTPAIGSESGHRDLADELLVFSRRVTDASRAIRWTISRQGLSLLETIHDTWGTAQMWQSIDDKAGLAKLLVEQRQQDKREHVQTLVGNLALALAVLSSVSAAADVLNLVDPSATTLGPGWPRLLAGVAAPLAIGFAILAVWLIRVVR